MRLGILGAGGIGHEIARAISEFGIPNVEVVGVAGTSLNSERAARVANMVGAPAITADDFLSLKPDWVVEAAGYKAVHAHALRLLDGGINLIVLSVGALLDDDLWREIQKRRTQGRHVILPSGGIGGLDAVQALNALGGLQKVGITSTKAPQGLRGAPHLVTNGIELPNDRVITIFEGTAREAIKGFPANVNVAAALSLAGVGPDRTTVRIISDPSADRTRHEIHAVGDTAEVRVVVHSKPKPDNPRTSYLAALSAISVIKETATEVCSS